MLLLTTICNFLGSDAKRQIRRKKPFVKKENEEACTIYVEDIPDYISQDQLSKAFSLFGDVSYVALPRYRHNRAIKGFAFVEFKEEDSVKKASLTFRNSSSFF